MNILKLAYIVIFFILGLSVGVLWSPFGGFSQNIEERHNTSRSHLVSDERFENQIKEVKKVFGEEGEYFVSQFKDMRIRIKEYPIDARASPDGRFDIRLFGSEKTIASDLRQIDSGGIKALNRHYAFTCGDLEYCCDFTRSIDDSTMYNVVFRIEVKGKPVFSYVDIDADGLWDWFTNYTQAPPKFYNREGLCWKERVKDASKESKVGSGDAAQREGQGGKSGDTH